MSEDSKAPTLTNAEWQALWSYHRLAEHHAAGHGQDANAQFHKERAAEIARFIASGDGPK